MVGCHIDFTNGTYSLGQAFALMQDRPRIGAFFKAYVCNSTISPPKRSQNINEAVDPFAIGTHSAEKLSRRKATKSRDYIIATMSHFPWYTPPAHAEHMDFSQLFADLATQSSKAGHSYTGMFTRSMLETSDRLPDDAALSLAREQPEPECMSDFVRLMGRSTRTTSYLPHVASLVHVHEISPLRRLRDQSRTARGIIIDGTAHGSVQDHSVNDHTWDVRSEGDDGDDPLLRQFCDAGAMQFISQALDLIVNVIVENDMTELSDCLYRFEATSNRPVSTSVDSSVTSGETQVQTSELLARRYLGFMCGSKDHPAKLRSVCESLCNDYTPRQFVCTTTLAVDFMLYSLAMMQCGAPQSALQWVRERFIVIFTGAKRFGLLSRKFEHLVVARFSSSLPNVAIVGHYLDPELTGTTFVLSDVSSKKVCGLHIDYNPRGDGEAAKPILPHLRRAIPLPTRRYIKALRDCIFSSRKDTECDRSCCKALAKRSTFTALNRRNTPVRIHTKDSRGDGKSERMRLGGRAIAESAYSGEPIIGRCTMCDVEHQRHLVRSTGQRRFSH